MTYVREYIRGNPESGWSRPGRNVVTGDTKITFKDRADVFKEEFTKELADYQQQEGSNQEYRSQFEVLSFEVKGSDSDGNIRINFKNSKEMDYTTESHLGEIAREAGEAVFGESAYVHWEDAKDYGYVTLFVENE
jgi:hypothetical protein